MGEKKRFHPTLCLTHRCNLNCIYCYQHHGSEDMSLETAENFIDKECFNNCYIYNLCPNCSGNNYLLNKFFIIKDKSKCRIQKLIALYSSDLLAKRIIKDPERYSDSYKVRVF